MSVMPKVHSVQSLGEKTFESGRLNDLLGLKRLNTTIKNKSLGIRVWTVGVKVELKKIYWRRNC